MKHTSARPPPVVVTLADVGDPQTSAVRLKRLLKCTLRSYGFRCRSLRTDFDFDKETKMKIGTCFPGKFLKASDLDGPRGLTIKSVEMVHMDRGNEEKPVVHFEETDQGLVLNVTNSKKITKLLGTDETGDWAGQQICIYPTTTDFAGEEVDAIRIREAEGVAPWE